MKLGALIAFALTVVAGVTLALTVPQELVAIWSFSLGMTVLAMSVWWMASWFSDPPRKRTFRAVLTLYLILCVAFGVACLVSAAVSVR